MDTHPTPHISSDFAQAVKAYVEGDSPLVIIKPLVKSFSMLCRSMVIYLNYEECLEILKAYHIHSPNYNKYDLEAFTQILTYYMKTWPALKKIQTAVEDDSLELDGKIFDTLDISYTAKRSKTEKLIHNWYKEFYIYIEMKLEYARSILKDKPDTKSVETQTEIRHKKLTEEPFVIQIQGPPTFLGSLRFSTDGMNIEAKPYPMIKKNDIDIICLKEFLNSPYVTVNLAISELSLSRSNVHEVERFLALGSNYMKYRQKEKPFVLDKRVQYVKTLDETSEVVVYSYKFLEEYIKQLKQLINKCKSVTLSRKTEIISVIEQFMLDAELLDDKKTIQTNIATCFILGNTYYYRRTFMSSVNFFEIIKPKILLSLKSFNVKQVTNSNEIVFNSIQKYETNIQEFEKMINNSNCLSYSCNMCSKIYSTFSNVVEHFKTSHTTEIQVNCGKCDMPLEVRELAGKRWTHCD